MGVKIGISPIAWQNDDLPGLTSGHSMEQALKEAREIGYSGVERGRRMPGETEELRRYLGEYEMQLCGGWCSGNLLENDVAAERQAIKGQVDLFAALDSPCIVYAECSNTVQDRIAIPASARPQLERDEILAYAGRLTELAKWTGDRGVPLAYHHHAGSIIESERDVNWLMEGSGPEVRLCFDTGHLWFAGGDVAATLDRWGERIGHVHYKDVRPDVLRDARKRDCSFLNAVIAGVFTVPGDGCIDFAEITGRLCGLDYAGWIVVEAEQDPTKAPPYEYAKLGYEHVVQTCRLADPPIEVGA